MRQFTHVRVVLDLLADGGTIRGLVSVPASTKEADRFGRMVHGWMELSHALESVRRPSRPPENPRAPEDGDTTATAPEWNLETARPTGGEQAPPTAP